MNDSQFDIERATNGLVLALYIAAAAFLAVMLYFVLRDIDERQQAAGDSGASSRLYRPSLQPGGATDTPAVPYRQVVAEA